MNDVARSWGSSPGKIGAIQMRDLLRRLHGALPSIRQWIDDLHAEHSSAAIAAGELGFPRLAASFPAALLDRAQAVTVARIPFPPVSNYGLPEFEAFARMPMAGITFDRMYFVHQSHVSEAIHFHELVHVIQWQTLGVNDFLLTYAMGLAAFGYDLSPLESIAFRMQSEFEQGRVRPDLLELVSAEARLARQSAAECFRANGVTFGR